MAEELVWANVMRPRIPLVYLDLNTIIYFARALRGHSNAPAGYAHLYAAALRAKREKRAVFPLGGEHVWENLKISDPRQRGALADVLGSLSDYNYLLGRPEIARLEFEAGIAQVMGEDISVRSLPLVRPTVGQAFGMVGGLKLLDAEGRDGSDAVRAHMSDSEFEDWMARLNDEFERRFLRGPSDEDLEALRADPEFRPEAAIEGQQKRLLWELDTGRMLDQDPKWRRGRLRDVISARELVHEWMDMFTQMRIDRVKAGRPAFDPSDNEMRAFMGAMPHTQVAISLKTAYHRNPGHRWTVNDITDIDAVAVAYAYCEAVFPDKAVRSALLHANELRAIETFVPRRPQELSEWLDALPTHAAPDLWVPHPLNRGATPTPAG